MKKTDNELIFIGSPIPFNTDEFLFELDELMNAAYDNKKDIRDRVMKVVSTYHPADNSSEDSPGKEKASSPMMQQKCKE